MKLLRRLARAEKAVAEKSGPTPRGIVWSMREVVLDVEELRAGEHVATDYYITGRVGDVPQFRTVQRAATEAGDLGLVYDLQRRVCGRVTWTNGGSMFDIDVPPDVIESIPETVDELTFRSVGP